MGLNIKNKELGVASIIVLYESLKVISFLQLNMEYITKNDNVKKTPLEH